MARGTFKFSASRSARRAWKSARKIMGPNYFGPEEAAEIFDVIPDEEDLRILSRIPFSKKKLRQCRETHYLVAVLPVSIKDLAKNGDFFMRIVCGFSSSGKAISFTGEESFFSNRGFAGWHLIETPSFLDTSGLKVGIESDKSAGFFNEILVSEESVSIRTMAYVNAARKRLCMQMESRHSLPVFEDGSYEKILSAARNSRGEAVIMEFNFPWDYFGHEFKPPDNLHSIINWLRASKRSGTPLFL